ncbi:MAG: type II toxin-antitoxin system HicB family antitoxin [Janthinobacterium lividum]
MTIETEREPDGRWLAEVLEIGGALSYGTTREQAIAHAQALALRVMAERLEHGETVPDLAGMFSIAA